MFSLHSVPFSPSATVEFPCQSSKQHFNVFNISEQPFKGCCYSAIPLPIRPSSCCCGILAKAEGNSAASCPSLFSSLLRCRRLSSQRSSLKLRCRLSPGQRALSPVASPASPAPHSFNSLAVFFWTSTLTLAYATCHMPHGRHRLTSSTEPAHSLCTICCETCILCQNYSWTALLGHVEERKCQARNTKLF